MNDQRYRYLAVALLLSLVQVAMGQPADSQRFRRVDVPEQHIQNFVDGLIPFSRQEFESLTMRQSRTQEPAFASAQYEVDLVEDGLEQGTALLKLPPNLDALEGSSSEADSFLVLGGTLAMQKPRWRDGAVSRSAVVGVGQDQTMVLRDERASVLEFGWSARGTQVGDVISFELDFPFANIQQMRVHIPRGLRLHVDRGVAAVDRSGGNAALDVANWLVSWSGGNQIRLTVHPFRTQNDRAGKPSYSQRSSYLLNSTGLKLRCQLNVRQGLDPVDTLRLLVDPSLTVTLIESGNTKLLWTKAADGMVVVELPQTTAPGSSYPIQVDAIGRYGMGKRFDLPRVRADANWISETLHWNVQRPVELADVRSFGCQCVALEQEADGSESAEFSVLSETASLQVVLKQLRADVLVESLVNVVLNKDEALARVEARLQPERGELFEFELHLADKEWVLEESSVECVAILASVIDRQEWDPNTRMLKIQLRQAATPESPVFLKLLARRRLPPVTMTMDRCMPIRFQAAAEDTSEWLLLESAPGFELAAENVVHGDWQRQADPTLPSWMQDILIASDGDLFLRKSRDMKRIRVRRREINPPPSVTTAINVTVGASSFRQSVELKVDPQGNEIVQLVVSFSESIPNGRWELLDRADDVVVKPVGAGVPQYALSFPPRSEPFQLRLEEFETPTSGDGFVPIPLISVSQTANEVNQVTLFQQPGITCERSVGEGLTPISRALLDVPPEQQASLAAAFRYNDTSRGIPRLQIRGIAEPAHEGILIWRCDAGSVYTEKGRSRHRANFFLQRENADRFECRLPDGFTLETVQIDGHTILPQPRLIDHKLVVPLVDAGRHPCVTVRYVQPPRTLRSIDWIEPPVPATATQPLQTTWQVWIPQDYRAYASGEHGAGDGDWLTRLMGPFSKDAEDVIDPLARWIRRRFFGGSSSIRVGQLLWRLGERQSVNAADDGLTSDTWGVRLSDIQSDWTRSSQFEILIDRPELRRLGVFPDSTLRDSRQPIERRREQGLDRLVQAGLAIVVDGTRLIITSAEEVRGHAADSELMDGVAIEGQEVWFAPSRLSSVRAWNADRERPLWRPATDELELGLLRGGWTPYRHIVDDRRKTLKVYHRDTVTAVSCVMFLFGFAFGWWRYEHKPRRWFIALGIGFALALVLPQPGARFAAAFAWAGVMGGLFRHVARRPIARRLQTDAPLVRIDSTRAAIWLLLCLSPFWNVDELSAQVALPPAYRTSTASTADDSESAELTSERAAATESEDQANRDSRGYQPAGGASVGIPQVYFPTDAEQQPKSIVYVPQGLHRRLRSELAARGRRPEYLFTSSLYSADWSDESDSSISIQARMSVTTLVPRCNVLLPRFGDDVVINAVMLDRKRVVTVPPDRVVAENKAGAGQPDPAIRIARPGEYELTIGLAVPVTRVLDERVFELSIPKIPESELRLDLPRNLVDVAVPSSRASVQTDLQRGILRAQMGPVDRLQVRAAFPAPEGAEKQGLDQYVLLCVVGQQVQVETRFRINDPKFDKVLLLRVDPRLTPGIEIAGIEIASTGDWQPSKSVLGVAASTIEEGVGPKFTMELRKHERRFTLPDVVPINARVRARMIAIETDGASIELNPRDANPIFESQFADGWAGLQPATRTYLSAEPDRPLKVDLEIQQNPLRWNSETVYLFGRSETSFEVEAELLSTDETESIAAHVLRLAVPPAMLVQDMLATRGGIPQEMRWSLGDDNRVSVFFHGQPAFAAREPIKLFVRGKLSKHGKDAFVLPLVSPEDVDHREIEISQTVTLYRSAEVALDVPETEAVELEDSETVIQRDGYRYAGTWHSDGVDSMERAFTISAAPANRRVRATLSTQMIHDEDGWTAEITTTLSARNGDVDSIIFDVPDSIAQTRPEAFEDNQALRVEKVREGPGKDRRVVTVWLPRDTKPNRTVTLRARIRQDRTTLPNVKLLNAQLRKNQHFVELPGSSDDGNSIFIWITTGLDEVTTGNVVRYQVTKTDFSADLDEVQAGSFRPEVHLLDTIVKWTSSKRYSAVSLFDLKPPNSGQCLLELPAGAALLQVMVDDHRVTVVPQPTPSGGKRWQVRLGAAPWPQRMRVTYVGECEVAMDATVTLRAPRLIAADGGRRDAIPILKEMWSVYGSKEVGLPILRNSKDEMLNLLRRDESQMRSFIDLWNTSKVLVNERPFGEQVANKQLWSQRFTPMIERFETLQTSDDLQQPNVNQLMADYNLILGNLPPLNDAALATDPRELWNESLRVSGDILHCLSEPSMGNALPTLRLQYPHATNRGAALRYLFAVAFLICPFVLPNWQPFRDLMSWCARFPHLLLGILGVVWWFVLAPSWLGILMVLLSLAIWTSGMLRHRRLVLPRS